MRKTTCWALATLLASCAKSKSENTSAAPASAPSGVVALVRGEPSASALAAPEFRHDDFEAALAEAKKKNVLLFVDAWAPWCHTCLSLREYVLKDPELGKVAPSFVWASLDTEKPSSAAFLAKFPMRAWPTLWVIDPATQKALLEWPGSLTTRELVALLADIADVARRGAPPTPSDAALARGDAASASGKRDDAIKAYREAIAAAATDWPRRARAVDSLVTQLSFAKDLHGCLEVADAELPKLSPGTSAVNVAVTGLSCTEGKKSDAADRIAAAAEKLVWDPSLAVLVDDRSSLFEALVDFRNERHEEAEAKRTARGWSGFLDSEAAKATTPAGRAVFDAHRLLAYEALGETEKAIPMLSQSERDFPDDYNPPARLAIAYAALKRWDDALAASDRALARVYGPRKLRVLAQRADIQLAKGDKEGAKATLAEAVKAGDAITLPEGVAKLHRDLKAKLAAM